MTIATAHGVLPAIVEHARADSPRECCGLLLGTPARIDEAFRAGNADPDPLRRFLVDPRDHFAAIRRARASGRAVVGAYHSHPRGPARPSPTDLAASLDPELLWVIVSLEGGVTVAGFLIRDGRSEPVSLESEGD